MSTKTIPTLKPYGKRAILAPFEKTISDGGIHLPAGVKIEGGDPHKISQAVVAALGEPLEPYFRPDGTLNEQRQELPFDIGSHVYFREQLGAKVHFGGNELIVLDYQHIFAYIGETEIEVEE